MTVLSIYKKFRGRAVDLFVLLSMLVIFVAQAAGDALDYPAAFNQQATDPGPAFAGTLHPTVARYVEFVNALQDDSNWQDTVSAIYAEDLYYSDTFMVADRRSQVEQHFANLRDADNRIQITVHDMLEGVQGTYLVWSINNQFSMLGDTVSSDTIGVTLFKFSEEGKIVFQQDFWDSTQGFYQHIPVLGSVIRSIRDRFVTE